MFVLIVFLITCIDLFIYFIIKVVHGFLLFYLHCLKFSNVLKKFQKIGGDLK